jgi:hypothetical protein
MKEMIYDRQNKRAHMMNLTFNSNIINNQNIRREIKNDEKNDDDAKENKQLIDLKRKSDI